MPSSSPQRSPLPRASLLRNPSLLTTIAVLLLFPAALVFFVSPRFETLLTTWAEEQSIEIARHMADPLHLEEIREAGGLTPENTAALRHLQQDFGVTLVRIYDAHGKPLYMPPGEHPNEHAVSPATLDVLRRGTPSARLLSPGEATTAGGAAGEALVETFVPIIKDGRFTGVFEIHLDMGRPQRTLHELTMRLDLGAVLLSLVLLVVAVLAARRETRAEDALQRSSQARDTLMAEASDAIFVFDEQDRLVEANAMARMLTDLGPAPGKGAGKGPAERPSLAGLFDIPDCPPSDACLLVPNTPESRRLQGSLKRRSGLPLPVEASFKRLKDGRAIVVARDISLHIEAERALRDQIAFLQSILDALPQPVFYKDAHGIFQGTNLAFQRFFGKSRDEILGRTIHDLAPEGIADIASRHDRMLLENPDEVHVSEMALPDAADRQVEALFSKAAYRNAAGVPVGIVGSFLDITRRKRAEEALQEANVRLEERVAGRTAELRAANEKLGLMAEVFLHSLDGILITDAKGAILQVNPAFSRITGYAPEEVLGQNPRVLKSDRHEEGFYGDMWQNLLRDGQWEGEIWNRRKNGEAYPEWLSISAIRGEDGQVAHFVAVFHDISEIKRSEELMKHQAYHDALTGLPNRLLLLDRLGVSISHAKRAGTRLTLLFLDMDNFKTVNDSLGHSLGDLLLMAFAHRLRRLLREQDTVARLGGDEFVVLVEDVESEAAAVAVGERILEALRRPFTVKHHELFITASIGITLYPEDGDTPETLLKNADLAMYRAKEQGRNSCQLFTPAMNERAHARLDLERSLRRAVGQKDFTVWFQPKVHLATGTIIGAEALVRWPRKDGSLVQPDAFIPLAEETGLITTIGEQVLEKACLEAKAWHDAGLAHAVAVNLSMRQLSQKGLVEHIAGVLERTGLDPALLEFEITETAIMSRVEQAVAVLRDIRDLGAQITVDDFGTGYSSLYYLKRFPIRGLKIDKSFVSHLPDNGDDLAIVRTVISMAASLGLHVTAEGVEVAAQAETLRALGCEFAQGYLFGRPMPGPDFLRLLRESGGTLLPPGGAGEGPEKS
ncbi:diguanylate cyclase/phosphodiesterase with PAS/PAC sensor(s) [Desulfovibrio sp. X2]|uniref:sensor domain-containing protein n=1 Tax=Desulfovibrio sp. X2 TaxID=941449 RepID=UPI000358A594|nr:EAL domain-containing protein [Desulfovibrio sp. X2]EPR40233.1 diguanylate cyclase/phosphodiesterase with PAS/PAC sensor(s) [Desulfovibrio sp. X2]